jgi:DNA-binding LacI/PurR family transcriptional regulator
MILKVPPDVFLQHTFWERSQVNYKNGVSKIPNIHDIARVSGVSKSTVSRVLNAHPHVSEESRTKVLEAIRQLSYVRNARAVHLRLQSSKLIGIIVPDLNHPYFSQLVSGLNLALREHGYRVVVYQTHFSEVDECQVYDKLVQKEMDGVIIAHSVLSERKIKERVQSNLAIICNEQFEGEWLDVYGLDEQDAIFQATAYLLHKGRRHLIFCMDHLTALQMRRWNGFNMAHQQFGLVCPESRRFGGLVSIQDGLELGNRLFASKLEIDGIIAGSDFVAAGLLRAAKINNVTVPDDVSLIGFDDHPICLVTAPELTTIANRVDEMVRDMVARLKQRLQGDACMPERKMYKGKLVHRASS